MRLPSKSRLIVILIAASAVSAVLLPASCTAWVRGLFQPVALAQWPVASATRAADRAVEGAFTEELSREEAQRLRAENVELRRKMVHQQLRLNELEQAFQRATGLRELLPDGDVNLVLAPVVAFDADPRRDTLRIKLNDDTCRRVKEGQWVAAGVLQTPSADLLDRQWLIGRVAEVHTRLARVQLATDPQFRIGVRVAVRGEEGEWRLGDEGCVLDGLGGGKMRISQARKDYLASREPMVMVPSSRELPYPLSIGEINSSIPRADSSKHFDLTVVPWGPVEALTHVFVISREEP